MATIIDLNDFKRQRDADLFEAAMGRPVINDGHIFARDFASLEGAVFGVLKVREILAYHLMDDGWQHLLFCLLDACHTVDNGGLDLLKESAAALKECVTEGITDENRKDMGCALLVLDLIEKSTLRKAPARG